MRRLFIRNARSNELFERFLISAVASLLAVRFYLYLTGYPQVGGGDLHIAHMLWGGALMLIAFITGFAFLGFRIQRLTAVVGGAGFGIFIDEIGKFITKDNDYFYQPAIGIIYAIFVSIYVIAAFLRSRRRLSSQEYQLNALAQYEEAVLNDFDSNERHRAQQLLAQAERDDDITRQLRRLIDDSAVIATDQPNQLQRLIRWLGELYDKAWGQRHSNDWIGLFFIAETIVLIGAVIFAVYDNIDDVRHFLLGEGGYGQGLVIGQLVATLIASGLVGRGLYKLRSSRRQALEYFRSATLTNLLLTQFFVFSRLEFGALPGFAFNLILLIIINFSLNREAQRTD